MHSSRPRFAAVLVVVAIAFAACSSSSATPTPTPNATAEATEAAATDAGSTAAASEGLPSSDKSLEEQLPTSFDGKTLTKFSLGGPGGLGSNPALGGLGVGSGDVSVAGAATEDGSVSFMAVRMKGAAEAILQQIFLMAAANSSGEMTKTSVGGRDVFKSTGGDPATYFYIKGDTAYGVTAPDEATAAKALGIMP